MPPATRQRPLVIGRTHHGTERIKEKVRKRRQQAMHTLKRDTHSWCGALGETGCEDNEDEGGRRRAKQEGTAQETIERIRRSPKGLRTGRITVSLGRGGEARVAVAAAQYGCPSTRYSLLSEVGWRLRVVS